MGWDVVPHVLDTSAGTVRWGCWGRDEHEPPLVLAHGTPFSAAVWREVLPALSRTRRVYLWDMPGFGRSAQYEGQDVGLANQARVLVELLRHWRVDRPEVVAHDVGGVVALRAALIEGADLAALTLVNAVAVPGWSSGAFFDVVKHHPHVFGRLPAFAHQALVGSKIDDASHRGLRPPLRAEFLAPWSGPREQAAFYRQYAQSDEADTRQLLPRLSDLTAPVRILWGRHDRWLPASYAERVRASLPHREFAWIEDAGHLVPVDAPAALLAHLLRPIDETAAGRAGRRTTGRTSPRSTVG